MTPRSVRMLLASLSIFVSRMSSGADVPATATSVAGAPTGYVVLTSAGDGRTLFIQKPDAKSAQAALESALSDLDKFFDGNATVIGAFADAKNNLRGGAFFTAKLKGKEIKGSMLCGVGNKGAAVSVMFDRADAPPAEWNKLMAALPSQMKTKVYQFPDGTGSLELPEGWTTNAQSAVGGVRVAGPADQVASLGMGLEVVTPDSQMVQLHNQLAAQARQFGQAPPPMNMLVAPFTGPVDALKNLMPQISALSQQNGGPALRLDRIITSADAQPSMPNSKAALIYFAFTKAQNGVETPYRSLAQMDTYPLAPGGWGIYLTELSAPDKTFDLDLPIMRQIVSSVKLNDQAIQQVTQQNIAASNQRFAAMQKAHQEQEDEFDRMNQAWRDRELVQSRSNDDFDEVIRGYRTMEDTATGEKTSVNLGDIDGVVNKLNERDPGRYKEIPLRDESDPLPGANR